MVLFLGYNLISASTVAPVFDELNSSIEGVVTDAETNQPLAGATVSLPDLKVAVTTGQNGHYVIKSLRSGSFTIAVSFVGYKSYVTTVAVNGATQKDFKLSVSVVENQAVVVTGVASSTLSKATPAHVSIISEKDLQRSGGTNLMQAIAKVPGVSVITTGPAIAKPTIRGLSYNRVVTLNDGVRQEGQQWGDEHGVEIDEYSARKVEVLRGPASLMYGSDALGGVINVLTNVPVTNNTIKANIAGNLNSNNNMQGGYADVAGNINGFNWNAYGSLKSAGDYKNKYDGSVLNSRFNEKNFGGYIGLNKSWGYTHLLFSSYDQQVGMVDGARDDAGNFILEGYDTLTSAMRQSRHPLIPNQHIQHFKVALDNSFNLGGGGRITALVAYQHNQRREFGDVATPDVPGSYFDLQTINYNLGWHLPVKNDWKTAFGVNGMSQQNQDKAVEALIPEYGLFDVGIYGVTTKTINKTIITGGVRFDNRNIDSKLTYSDGAPLFQAFKKNLSSFSGSIGLTHDISDQVTLKANASKGFRAPNMAELAANGVHEGTFRYEIGNQYLKSEDAYALDLGLDVNTQHVSLNVSPYFNHINNYIFLQKLLNTAGADSLISNVTAYKYDQQSANLYGVEASLDIHPHPLDWLHFENTFSYTRGKFTNAVDGSNNLPLIAPMRLLTELRTEFPTQLHAFRNLYARVEMNHVWAQNDYFSGYQTETPVPGYTLFNAGIGSDIYVGGTKRASLVLALNNIGNVAYQDFLGRLRYAPENPATGRVGVFEMGRNFTARLIIPFEWKVQ